MQINNKNTQLLELLAYAIRVGEVLTMIMLFLASAIIIWNQVTGGFKPSTVVNTTINHEERHESTKNCYLLSCKD